jgi:hypothetical protein
VKDEPFFGLDDVDGARKFLDDEVQDRHFLLVRKHAEHDQR